MLLSAALIVRNEAENLARCLPPLASFADDIVVVDTGSDDETRAVARSAGARVFEFQWSDDYAAARNEALRHCRGEWVLSVDADEIYRPCPREELSSILGSPSTVAGSTWFRIRDGFTPYRRVRLFRNHPLIRFAGIIHENVLAGLDRYRERYGGDAGDSPLFADHVGYDGDQREKNLRNLPILLRCAEQEPGKVIVWCHLANVYASLGEAEKADGAWRRAVAVTGRCNGRPSLYDSVAYLGLIEWQLSRDEDAQPLVSEARDLFPGNLHLLWYEGRLLMRQGSYREATARFEELLAARRREDFLERYGNPADDWDHWFGYDERLFHVLSFESLATCHFRLGRYAESLRFLDLAARREPARGIELRKCLCRNLLQVAGAGTR